jgi:hypothetical protein
MRGTEIFGSTIRPSNSAFSPDGVGLKKWNG